MIVVSHLYDNAVALSYRILRHPVGSVQLCAMMTNEMCAETIHVLLVSSSFLLSRIYVVLDKCRLSIAI